MSTYSKDEIIKKLDKIKNSFPDIKRYKKPWHKFFKLNVKKINLKKYKNVRKAVDMIFGEFSFETEKGYFNKMRVNIQNLNNDELKIFITKFSKYSGDYVRNVLSLLNNANETQYEIITNGLKNCMKDVNNRILFQLYDRILNLLEKENLKPEIEKVNFGEMKKYDEMEKIENNLTIENKDSKIEENKSRFNFDLKGRKIWNRKK